MGLGRMLLIVIAALLRSPPAAPQSSIPVAKRPAAELGSPKLPAPATPLIAGNPVMIVRSVLIPSPGVRTSIEAAYAFHKGRCATLGLAPLPPREFGEAARDFCRAACVRAEGQFMIDVDVGADDE
jgi:hypothetical protein